MEFSELKKFIKMESERLRQKYGVGSDEEKRVLVRAVKLTEEVGELCNQVLIRGNLQREEKMDDKLQTELEEEVADVIITAMLLAKTMNVDIEKALEKKIKKINNRYEK